MTTNPFCQSRIWGALTPHCSRWRRAGRRGGGRRSRGWRENSSWSSWSRRRDRQSRLLIGQDWSHVLSMCWGSPVSAFHPSPLSLCAVRSGCRWDIRQPHASWSWTRWCLISTLVTNHSVVFSPRHRHDDYSSPARHSHLTPAFVSTSTHRLQWPLFYPLRSNRKCHPRPPN